MTDVSGKAVAAAIIARPQLRSTARPDQPALSLLPRAFAGSPSVGPAHLCWVMLRAWAAFHPRAGSPLLAPSKSPLSQTASWPNTGQRARSYRLLGLESRLLPGASRTLPPQNDEGKFSPVPSRF
ncbi:uncharacterized protein LOC123856946 [Mirounga angustirostris]|uniref:uncharacterized protein LOC123856946 n=1 Tax=Mirounga angustirostris TaxID=9716 RepID=UPI00313E8C0B